MIKNYLKIAFRNLKKHKAYSLINIAGLAIGMATCIMILLWVNDELRFDRFHDKGDHLYRIICSDMWSGERFWFAETPAPLAPALKEEFPEIINSTRYNRTRNVLFKQGETKFVEETVGMADPSFLEMFTFPMIKGDPKSALDNSHSVILTESSVQKYFGDQDPLGQSLSWEGQTDFTVTGVIRDVPRQSHIQFSMLIPFEYLEELDRSRDSWGRFSYYTYVELHPESAGISEERLTAHYQSHFTELENIALKTFPVAKIHLYGGKMGGIGADGNITNVYIFSAVALIVLLIACINFMNLTTARSSSRAKEVGMRKVVGAFRKDIVKQFFGESLLMAALALLLATALTYAFIPLFSTLTGKPLHLNFSGNPILYFGLAAIVLLTGLVSGSYPALLLSRFQPIWMFRGSAITASNTRSWFRRILVVFQFSLSIILIIGTTVVYLQLDFIRHKNLGFNKEHLVILNIPRTLRNKFEVLKTELLKNPNIQSVSSASDKPFGGISATLWEGKNKDKNVDLFWVAVTEDYLETMGMEMKAGRFFSSEFPSDTKNFVINETAVMRLELEEPLVGQQVEIFEETGTIVGILKDYHFQSLHSPIGAQCLVFRDSGQPFLFARVKPGNLPQTLQAMEEAWNSLENNYAFTYSFFDEDFDRIYRSELKFGEIFKYFSILAIFISCLGLFGLSSFMAEQRTKEIGVRKILGASAAGIAVLLSKEFTKWVLIANMIAWPAAYFIMDVWLGTFAYHTNIQIWIFLGSAVLALVIALLTVSFQAVKAALSNPVTSLRYE